MEDINPMIPHCSQHQTASVSETAYWIHGCIIGEMDPGSVPDFEAKKTCWPNRGTASMASVMCFHWAQRYFFPLANIEKENGEEKTNKSFVAT